MTNRYRLSLPLFVWSVFVLAGSACRSASPRPEPTITIARKSTPIDEVTMAEADSEVFAAVVRTQMAGGTEDYPIHVVNARYDARPYGSESGYPEIPAGIQGAAPELVFGRARPSVIRRIAEQRRRIMRASAVREGAAVMYSQCAGVGVPEPPPPKRGSGTSRVKGKDVHAGCPKKQEIYITVGLPVRGQPEGLREVRDSRGDRVDLDGDVWMAQVDQRVVGPDGWMLSQHAWLFKRNRDGELELASTVPIATIK